MKLSWIIISLLLSYSANECGIGPFSPSLDGTVNNERYLITPKPGCSTDEWPCRMTNTNENTHHLPNVGLVQQNLRGTMIMEPHLNLGNLHQANNVVYHKFSAVPLLPEAQPSGRQHMLTNDHHKCPNSVFESQMCGLHHDNSSSDVPTNASDRICVESLSNTGGQRKPLVWIPADYKIFTEIKEIMNWKIGTGTSTERQDIGTRESPLGGMNPKCLLASDVPGTSGSVTSGEQDLGLSFGEATSKCPLDPGIPDFQPVSFISNYDDPSDPSINPDPPYDQDPRTRVLIGDGPRKGEVSETPRSTVSTAEPLSVNVPGGPLTWKPTDREIITDEEIREMRNRKTGIGSSTERQDPGTRESPHVEKNPKCPLESDVPAPCGSVTRGNRNEENLKQDWKTGTEINTERQDPGPRESLLGEMKPMVPPNSDVRGSSGPLPTAEAFSNMVPVGSRRPLVWILSDHEIFTYEAIQEIRNRESGIEINAELHDPGNQESSLGGINPLVPPNSDVRGSSGSVPTAKAFSNKVPLGDSTCDDLNEPKIEGTWTKETITNIGPTVEPSTTKVPGGTLTEDTPGMGAPLVEHPRNKAIIGDTKDHSSEHKVPHVKGTPELPRPENSKEPSPQKQGKRKSRKTRNQTKEKTRKKYPGIPDIEEHFRQGLNIRQLPEFRGPVRFSDLFTDPERLSKCLLFFILAYMGVSAILQRMKWDETFQERKERERIRRRHKHETFAKSFHATKIYVYSLPWVLWRKCLDKVMELYNQLTMKNFRRFTCPKARYIDARWLEWKAWLGEKYCYAKECFVQKVSYVKSVILGMYEKSQELYMSIYFNSFDYID